MTYEACTGDILVHKGFVWAYRDSDNPESLLDKKCENYIYGSPKRGPKAWQYKGE